MALGAELLPELPVVLDDAVVHDRDATGAVEVRMGVVLDRRPVGRPAGVADAGGAACRGLSLQPSARSRGSARGRRRAFATGVLVDEGDAGRVVAAVLESSVQGLQSSRPRKRARCSRPCTPMIPHMAVKVYDLPTAG